MQKIEELKDELKDELKGKNVDNKESKGGSGTKNIKIVFSYDGNEFYGLQKQPNLKTVQGELEKAIFEITGQNTELIASGRTDRFVSALKQVANFKINSDIALENLKLGINSKCKGLINIIDISEVDFDFHSRYSAKKKTYIYVINNSDNKSTIKKDRELYVSPKLDMSKMKAALKYLEGEHDFKAFESKGSPKNSTVRTIYSVDINICKDEIFGEERIVISLTGSGFLYNMVRIIVGTLVDIGLSKKEPEIIRQMIESKDRNLGGKTIQAEGLYLESVEY